MVSFQLVAKATPEQVIPAIPSTIRPITEDWFLEIVALGVRNLAPYDMQRIYLPFVEFDVGDRSRSAQVYSTGASKSPSGPDANYLERIMVPVKLPQVRACVGQPGASRLCVLTIVVGCTTAEPVVCAVFERVC